MVKFKNMSNRDTPKFPWILHMLVLAGFCLFAIFLAALLYRGDELKTSTWRYEECRKAIENCHVLVLNAEKAKLEVLSVPTHELDKAVFHAQRVDRESVILTKWLYALLTVVAVQAFVCFFLSWFSFRKVLGSRSGQP